MDGEGGQYEERLRDLFQSFDGSGAGSLSPEELAELCQALHLGDSALHTLLLTLLDAQGQLPARVEFEQFKNALILVLSSTEETPASEESHAQPGSPEVQPRFVKGSKRYGRRSQPEFARTTSGPSHAPPEKDQEASGGCDWPTRSKHEHWNAVSSPEEYEAEGQLHLWNPDDPVTPCSSLAPFTGLEESLQQACQQLSLSLNGTATLQQLHALCQHLGMEVGEDVLQAAGEGCVMSVEGFVSYILNNSKPLTPSASTPYRQLKRHHSTQPFDEAGRRISSVMSSTIGLRLFSTLDDGTGHTAVEQLLDAWLEEGVDGGCEILQALDFSLDGKVNLGELTAALENELLVAKNSIHQAALASFKAEIRHLLERVDLELREKEKIISDLEKAEKLKCQLASEVDEHHSAIERINDLNLRKLEQEHKERMVAVRTELSKEVELVQQQANQQREELEHEISRIREDENFLREQLTVTIKENGRLQAELLESTQRLEEAEQQLSKVQKNLDNALREKFGDLDLSNAELYQQEERLRQLRSSYEEQCLELQDRIDELQLQLEEYRALGRAPPASLRPSLCEELQGQSPGMDSDQGLGSEDTQPFNMSLEAEMMLEKLREQHVGEMDNIRAELDSTVNDCQHRLEEQQAVHQQEVQAVKEEVTGALERAQNLQELLVEERHRMEVRQGVERAELYALHQQELSSLRLEAQDTRNCALQLEEQIRELKERWREEEQSREREGEERVRAHAEELSLMELRHKETLEFRLQEVRARLQGEREEALRRLAEEWQREHRRLEETNEEVLRVRLKEAQQSAQQEQMELERRLREQWERERQQLEEGNKAALEKELEHLLKEREEREKSLAEQQEKERRLLEDRHHVELQQQLMHEGERLKEVEGKITEQWERERARLQEQHKEELQASLAEQRERLQAEREEQERRWQEMVEEQQGRMEEVHKKAMQELSARHCEEREKLSCMVEKLHADIGEERSEAGRLAEENLILRQKISALRQEDLREKHQELILQVEHLRKEMNASQKMADGLKRQVSELRCHGLQLEEENSALSQQNAKHLLTVDTLQHTLEEVIRNGSGSSNDKSEVEPESFTSAVTGIEKLEEEKKLLRAELDHCVEKLARLRSVETQLAELLYERQTADKHQQALRTQLLKAQEKVQALDSTLQGLTQQNVRLKSDLRAAQQEGDVLKQEVISLHKQLHNASEKCRLVEMSVSGVSGGSQQGRRVWLELSRLREAELTLLREANQRLQREIAEARLELNSAREKGRQLEVLVLSVKQQKQQNQVSLAKAAEQERSSLKREIEALKTQLHNRLCDSSEEQREMESLQEENDRLRNNQTVLEAQLMEAQLIAMLPPSPRRLSGERRGQRHGDEMNPDINVQEERELTLLKMEERMKEVELTLRNVKLLLQEKVSQLKEQLNKNSKADLMIKDLYVENAQLLKALEMSEQRHKMAEKKNYLLEEKISSLNKIVRELRPSPLTPIPYHLTRS